MLDLSQCIQNMRIFTISGFHVFHGIPTAFWGIPTYNSRIFTRWIVSRFCNYIQCLDVFWISSNLLFHKSKWWYGYTTPPQEAASVKKSPHRRRRSRCFTISASRAVAVFYQRLQGSPWFSLDTTLVWMCNTRAMSNHVSCIYRSVHGFSGKPPICHVVPRSESWPHIWPLPGALPEQERQSIVICIYLFQFAHGICINCEHLFKCYS